jgi:putative transposase
VSKETISRITDKVPEEMTDWCNRPLGGVYAAVFVDAVVRHEALCIRVEVGDLHRLTIFNGGGYEFG